MIAFSDRLIASIRASGAPACVGLDPVLDKLPAVIRSRHHEPTVAIEEFCTGVIDALTPASGPIIGVVKPQSACFERYGHRGYEVLERVCHHAAQRGLTVILDAKRGDIGISADHYAAAAVKTGAHAITVNAYLGPSTVEPYLKAGLGVFVLVRTSNPDSDLIQSRALNQAGATHAIAHSAPASTVAELLADTTATLAAKHMGTMGYSNVGAVVGATKPADGRALRARMPQQFFLVPGYGAQGGTADDVRMLLDGRLECGQGVIVSASRSVIYPDDPAFHEIPAAGVASNTPAWKRAVMQAAIKFAEDLQRLSG